MTDKNHETPKGTVWTYSLGFILSLALTLTAYFAVKHHISTGHLFPSDKIMLAVLALLAAAQLGTQLVFFLHLNHESKPRWNLTVFAFMLMVLVIIVAGSLWIMNNLNYHMNSEQTSKYLKNQESGGL
jgi:cytochrome o ubiquinol oxidase subunit IV